MAWPSTNHYPLLSVSRHCSGSMAAVLSDHAASVNVILQLCSSQPSAVSSRPPDTVIFSRILSGRSGASPHVQRLTLYSLRCSSKLWGSTSVRSFLAAVTARRKHREKTLHNICLTCDRVVSRHQQTRVTYDGLDRKSNDLARGLLQRGVKKGDRVAVSLGNNIEYAIVRGLELGTKLQG